MFTKRILIIDVAVISIFILCIALVWTMARSGNYSKARDIPTFQYSEELVVERNLVQERAIPQIPKAAPLPITPPRIIYQVLPDYPLNALREGLEGVVLLSLFVSRDGYVKDVKIERTSGYEEFDKSAIAAAYSWKFSPAIQGVAAIDSWFKVPVRFVITYGH